MNQEDREPREQDADSKSKSTRAPTSDTGAKESEKHAPESTNRCEKAAPLHHVTRWDRFKKWASKMTVAEAGMLLLTLVIAGSSIVYTVYVHRQWKIMGGQLEQMKGGSAQTERLITETHTLATNAGTQATNAANEVTKVGALVSAANKQAIATEGQLSVMQKQFEAAERPWIDAEIAPDGPIRFNDRGGADVFFKVTMSNVGHSVAVAIDVEFGAANGTSFGTNQIEAVCSDVKHAKKSPGRGDTVFPGQSLTRHFFAEIRKQDLMRPDQFLQSVGDSQNRLFAPKIFGCVDYEFDFAEGHHQTWFAETVNAIDPLSGQEIFPAKDRGDIPANRVRMHEELSIGHWAN